MNRYLSATAEVEYGLSNYLVNSRIIKKGALNFMPKG